MRFIIVILHAFKSENCTKHALANKGTKKSLLYKKVCPKRAVHLPRGEVFLTPERI